jgi:N4-(beta-N-acetylglucosaminyl)-L-asparaginase
MAHGFKQEDLLTPEARRKWLHWKETRSDTDDWIPPEVPDEDHPQSSRWRDQHFSYGTITCSAVDASGNLSGVTTTSGLSFKLAGRVGDSPIIGAGLYVHNDVGAAGSTGRGEAVIRVCGAHTVVEQMAQGRAPQEACLKALQRIVDLNHAPRLRRRDGRPNFDVKLYALNKQGGYGAAAIWSNAQFAVSDAAGSRLEQCAYLFTRPEKGIRD